MQAQKKDVRVGPFRSGLSPAKQATPKPRTAKAKAGTKALKAKAKAKGTKAKGAKGAKAKGAKVKGAAAAPRKATAEPWFGSFAGGKDSSSARAPQRLRA